MKIFKKFQRSGMGVVIAHSRNTFGIINKIGNLFFGLKKRIILDTHHDVYTKKSLHEYNDLRRYGEVTLMLLVVYPSYGLKG